MAYPSEHYGVMCSNGVRRVVLALVALFLLVYIVGPKLNSMEAPSPQASSSCPCDCDCIEDFAFALSFESINDSSYADCGENDPEMKEEMKKDLVALLSEEVHLLEAVANDTLQRTNGLIRDAGKSSYHFQMEAEKCSAQMDACEAARERAEAELAEEVKLTELWEKRAREIGWYQQIQKF